METNPFKKAERRRAKLKIALTGPSGSGKTYSALLLAKGLTAGKKIAFIDTENESASLYADTKGMPEYDVLVITQPYTIKKYQDAIKAAVDAEYGALVIDSITHAWAGEGGLLSKKEVLDSRGGNSYTNWASITKDHEAFKASLLNADIHLICTMRSKQDYALVENDKGKIAPKKLGMAPIQREGMEYEFTTVLDMDMSHHAEASKDRTGLFDGQIFKPTEETGKALAKWLEGGKEEKKPELSREDLDILNSAAELANWNTTGLRYYMKCRYGTDVLSTYTRELYNELINTVRTSTQEAALAKFTENDGRMK